MDSWDDLRTRTVIWEDDDALVLNKPAGLSVMGERHDTDLVTIAQDAGEKLHWVHRIDKVTSGAVLLAKTLDAHGALTRQFAKRTVDKAYLVVTRSGDLPPRGTIDLPLVKAGSGRIRVAADRADITSDGERWFVPAGKAFTHTKTYPSRTDFVKLWEDADHAVLAAYPVTGRRHQIRVHLAWVGYAIDGDPLFDKSAPGRTHLHSWRLGFDAGSGRVDVTAVPGEDFWLPLGPGFDPAAVLTP